MLVLSILGETKRAEVPVVRQHEDSEGHDIVQSNLSCSWIVIYLSSWLSGGFRLVFQVDVGSSAEDGHLVPLTL